MGTEEASEKSQHTQQSSALDLVATISDSTLSKEHGF